MSENSESFEQTLEELEGIVSSLETDELDLEEALRLFERGVERLRVAAASLDSAHGRVEELVEGVDGQAQIVGLELTDEASGDPDGR